jgi:hypothetical protein
MTDNRLREAFDPQLISLFGLHAALSGAVGRIADLKLARDAILRLPRRLHGQLH